MKCVYSLLGKLLSQSVEEPERGWSKNVSHGHMRFFHVFTSEKFQSQSACVCIYACMCAHVYVCVCWWCCMWRLEINLGNCSSGTIHLVFLCILLSLCFFETGSLSISLTGLKLTSCFETGSLTVWNSSRRAGWMTSEPGIQLSIEIMIVHLHVPPSFFFRKSSGGHTQVTGFV